MSAMKKMFLAARLLWPFFVVVVEAVWPFFDMPAVPFFAESLSTMWM